MNEKRRTLINSNFYLNRLNRTGFLLILFSILFSSCITYEELDFGDVEDIRTREAVDGIMPVDLDMEIENPNTYTIKIIKGELSLSLSGTDAGTALIEDKIKLQKKSKKLYTLTLHVNKKKLIAAAMSGGLSAALTSNVVLKMKGWIKGRVFIFGKKVDVSFSEKIPLSAIKNL